MFRRISTLACAAVAGAALVGLSAGTADADPTCPDVHWIGAAGSGERAGTDLTTYNGMGRVVYESLHDLSAELQKDGRTMTAEAVDYPAVPAPDDDGGVGEWLGFIGSVDAGAKALGDQYAAFVAAVPDLEGGAGRLLAGRDGGAPESARTRRKPEPGRRAADRRRRPATGRSHPQLGHSQWHPGAREGCRPGLADPRACARTAGSGNRRPHDQRLRSQRCGLRLQRRRR